MRYQFIDDHRTVWPIDVPCLVRHVSRSGYYAWRKRPPSAQARRRAALTACIREIHDRKYHEVSGAPRMHRELVAQGQVCHRKTVAKCRKAAGIQARPVKTFRVNTTDSNHLHPLAENVVNRDFSPSGKNPTWTADITDIPTDEGWLYLAAVEDLFTRQIVGWSMSERIDSRLVVDVLEMAIRRQCPGANLVAHSDRGVQYASEHYQRLLAKQEITCSMSRKGNCWEATEAAEPWRGSRPKGGSTPRPNGKFLRHLEERIRASPALSDSLGGPSKPL